MAAAKTAGKGGSGPANPASSAKKRKLRIGLVLSGVGPSLTLMAGAMRGFADAGVEFDAISATSAGALVGMTYLAPKGSTSCQAALEGLSELFVSDALYDFVPMNFKAFHKYGRFSEPIWRLGKGIPRFPVRDDDGLEELARLANDWIDLWITALTPTTLTMSSKGLMSHAPIVDDLIDFDKLRESDTRFYLSAFNNSERRLEVFCNQKHAITAEHYEAAQSMLFLFPPKRIKSQDYSIGATHEPTGLQALWCDPELQSDPLDVIIALDPVTEAYLREPTDIYDAFQLMLMSPVTALQDNFMTGYAEAEFHCNDVFDKKEFSGTLKNKDHKITHLPMLYYVPLKDRIGKDYFPEMLKWSRSNAETLDNIGYAAAEEFAELLNHLPKDEVEADWKIRKKKIEEKLPEETRYHSKLADDEQKKKKRNALGECLNRFAEVAAELFGPNPAGDAAPDPNTDRPAGNASNSDKRNDQPSAASPQRAVLLGAGAPTMHIAAGALCAFHEKEFEFDVVAASGAGALPGLLYAVPKNKNPAAALRSTVDLNIEDLIFDTIPGNFKVFQKRGPFTELFWEFGRLLPRFAPGSGPPHIDSLQHLYSDLLDFTVAAATPTTLNYTSQSVCTRVTQLLDDIVDWDRLRTCERPRQYLLNAFSLDRQELELFTKDELNSQSFFAALAMPWLFEPMTVGGSWYTEGATHDPSGLEALWDALVGDTVDEVDNESLDEIVVVESITSEMWNDPRDLYDSLRLTIMDPVVALTEQILATYGKFELVWNTFIEAHYAGSGKEIPRKHRMPKLYMVPCDVSVSQSPNILEWSRSNGQLLWHVGHEQALEFCEAFASEDGAREKYRYYRRLENGREESRLKWRRISEILKVYDPILVPLSEYAKEKKRKQYKGSTKNNIDSLEKAINELASRSGKSDHEKTKLFDDIINDLLD